MQKQDLIDQLPPYDPRRFVPNNANLRELAQIQKLYEQLLARGIHSTKDLEEWLLNRSELEAAIEQASGILYIRMTCQTDDEQRANDYRHFIETIVPGIESFNDKLNQKYLKEIENFSIDAKRYYVHNRELKTDKELFREENIPLQTQVSLLSQEYQTVSAAMTVHFEGKERTLPEMGKFLLETDRALRERAWRATAERRLKDAQKLDEIFGKMLALRVKIAQNAGCKNFCDYKFRSLHRFDYTPEDCKKYHTSIESLVVPLWRKILERRRQQMKLESLRPWDTAVDPLGRAPLKPFEDVKDLIEGCQKIFAKVDPELGQQFSQMIQKGLLDLQSRKGKAPGGYQSALDESRKPFIFMNAVGLDQDVRTLLHEAGHAFHTFACAHDSLVNYRHGPMEFNEVASMAMELLGGKYLDVFYKKDDFERSVVDHLEDIVYILGWVAVVDAFQHWIYENPNHSSEERLKQWIFIHKRFGGDLINWDGLQKEHEYLWHRQLHIFEVPFYYIEYGIAQLGALQVWSSATKHGGSTSGGDWAEAVASYRRGLSLGGSRPLPELYQTTGIRFDFSENTIAPLMEMVKKELGF